MSGNYTKMIEDRYFGFEDAAFYEIWDAIESLSPEENKDVWRHTIETIAQTYALSSRLAMIRLLISRHAGIQPDEVEPEASYVVSDVVIEYLTPETAESLDDGMLSQLEGLVPGIFGMEMLPDEGWYLVFKAFKDPVRAAACATVIREKNGVVLKGGALDRATKADKMVISRSEAIDLGHYLGFSIEEMSWFLYRVTSIEGGFHYHCAYDLIDAYGLITGADLDRIKALKAAYDDAAAGLAKAAAEEKPPLWTISGEDSLMAFAGRIKGLGPVEADEAFMRWMIRRSPWLDLPTRTATKIYRQMAAWIYLSQTQESGLSDPAGFKAEMNRIAKARGDKSYVDHLLFKDGLVEPDICKQIQKLFLKDNKLNYSANPDRIKAWSLVMADENGSAHVETAGEKEASRNRLAELLMGQAQVKKGDLLQLLWYGFNVCYWESERIEDDPDALFENFADFVDLARDLLDAALLPAFYPPHILEQSMMLSIIACCKDTGVPGDTYGEVLEHIRNRRQRKKG